MVPNPIRRPVFDPERFFPGNSEMAGRMRSFDWTSSDLGHPENWPENLRVAVQLCVTARFPILLCWGPALDLIYNDAFLPWLGQGEHPRAFMQPGHEASIQNWDAIASRLATILNTHTSTWSEDLELVIDGNANLEHVIGTVTFTPILSADGGTVDGILCPVTDNAGPDLGARRLETLRKLSVRTAPAQTVEEACNKAAAVLNENTRDLPFAAIYVSAGEEAKLAATTSHVGEHFLPASVPLSAGELHSAWPLDLALRTKRAADGMDLIAKGVKIAVGCRRELIDRAVVVPILAAPGNLAGLLVAGLSPRLPLDPAYRTFLDLVAGHIATAISGARACEAKRKRDEAPYEIDSGKEVSFSTANHDLQNALGPLTERQLAVEALRASEERFRSLVLGLPAALYTCDAEGRITLYNDAAVTLWGRAPELYKQQWCGSMKIYRTDGSVLPLDDCPMAAAVKGGVLIRGEEVFVERPDGTRRNVLAYPHPIRDGSGRLIGAANMLLDITDQKAAQMACVESEARFRRYFELGLIGMATTSPTKGILEVNDEICRILGYERAELLNKTWAELTHPDDLDADVAQFNRVLAGEIDEYTLDKRWIRKDGRVIDSIVSVRCQRRPDGLIDYFVGLLQDITGRKRAESHLASHANLLANVHYAILATDARLNLTAWNRAAEEIYQWEAEEVLGRKITDVIRSEFNEVQSAEYWRVVGKNGRHHAEAVHYRRDGLPIYVQGDTIALRDEDGEISGYVCAFRDITERRQAEEELRRTQAELSNVTRLTALGEFGAAVAHEVNQPLGAIVNNANVLLRLISGEGEGRYGELYETISDIVSDANRASSIIARIRGLMKQTTVDQEILSVKEVISEVLAILRHELVTQQVTVRTDMPDGLLPVRGDRVQLQQVVLNLLMNAVDAMSTCATSGRTVTISGQTDFKDGHAVVLVRVHDLGVGFNHKDGEQMFDAFYSTKREGLGMGLRISRSIIEAHGGRLWAQANEARGSTFIFYLPVDRPQQSG